MVISSAENIANIDEIRTKIAKLADPRSIEEDEIERIIDEPPAITWIGDGLSRGYPKGPPDRAHLAD